jgi:hypothetical protein
LFTENEPGRVEGNCGDITFGAVDPAVNNHLLSGALAYIDALPPNCGYLVLRDADIAWRRLKRAIVKPTEAELRCLELGGRSVDFGRPEVLPVYARRRNMTVLRKLLSAKKQLWREGAIARDFPLMKHLFLPMFGSVLSLRGLLARQR